MNAGRGRGRGGGSQQKLDLVPTLPPLYPPCNDPSPLNPNISRLVPKHNEMRQHMISNFAVPPVSCHPAPPGFVVDRFSDRYCAPLQLKKILTYEMDPRRLPCELGSSKSKKPIKRSMKAQELKAKRALEKLASLPDEDEPKDEEDDNEETVSKRAKPGGVVDEDKDEDDEKPERDQDNDDDEEEDLDEELDEGNDYEKSHFDNGEGYGDSDEDNLEDSSVY